MYTLEKKMVGGYGSVIEIREEMVKGEGLGEGWGLINYNSMSKQAKRENHQKKEEAEQKIRGEPEEEEEKKA